MSATSPLPSIDAVLSDFASSHWLKQSLVAAMRRDPVDALYDAELLHELMRRRCEEVLQSHNPVR